MRKGDIVYKETDKLYQILMESNENKEESVRKFIERLKSQGIKIKKFSVIK
ncbi:hypothetical protein [Thermosipho melanesiensis]|uniref:hypothetical protein n=1 Tax=Thermosipho melanesiensis TaxID=46541 RepID=UPI0002EB130F|nr:hypothetical protein [Thermosipho melanesiensis]